MGAGTEEQDRQVPGGPHPHPWFCLPEAMARAWNQQLVPSHHTVPQHSLPTPPSFLAEIPPALLVPSRGRWLLASLVPLRKQLCLTNIPPAPPPNARVLLVGSRHSQESWGDPRTTTFSCALGESPSSLSLAGERHCAREKPYQGARPHLCPPKPPPSPVGSCLVALPLVRPDMKVATAM